ncbi:MAG TPA: DUF4397 domain-containing protein [Casimicrobiaceae bacterium]|nr:DUF4397 domain-containing protein [Casimicrobiaceae bacterium]
MNSRRAITFVLFLVSVALAGCGSKGGGSNARIRVLNAIPDAASISVALDTNPPFVSGLAFEQTTQYTGVDTGSREFKVSANGGASNVVDTTLSVNNADYTYIVYGPVSAAVAGLFQDSGFSTPNSGNFAVRFINAAAGVGPLDLYLTAPGVDINTTSATVPNVNYGNASAFTTIPNGTYEIRVTAANTKDVVFDTPAQSFTDQSQNNIVAVTKGSARLVDVGVLHIDSNGTGQVFQNLLAEFKVINATSVPSPLNVSVDGVLTLSNVPFTGVSNYTTTTAGSHTFTVQATSTPGSNLVTLVNTLNPATDTSFVFSGPAGAILPLVLGDNNLPPAIGHARIRYVNVAADFPALDVYVNFAKQVSNLTFNSASSYVDVTADTTVGTPFEFDFNTAGTVTPVLKMTNAVIIGGHNYTVYVMESAGTPQGVLTKDD